MKLIIDIPEEVYAECRGDIYFPDTGGELFNAVKNGIPLDDVKAEIADIPTVDFFETYRVKTKIFEILDNIGKAESENKE